jgi:hypothetical protein
MLELKIFGLVWGAMIATSFWEAYVEGKHAWDEGKLGWKIRWREHVILTAYHFWLFWVMYPLLLLLPLAIFGWDSRIFGIIASAFFSGLMVEDFFWFVVNPVFTFKHFSKKYVKWYPWIKIGRFEIPFGYVFSILVSVGFWYYLWR